MKINMFSKAESIKGQGVGSAYRELIDMLESYYSDSIEIQINKFDSSDISHYHTINPTFYLSTFAKSQRGIKLGYVHFLPETLTGSIKLGPLQKLLEKYVLSFYNRMDHLVVVNPVFGEELADNYAIDQEKITYIPNFVSTDSFHKQSPEKILQFKESLNIDPDRFTVIGVGQIQKRKGIDDFIKLAQDHPEIQFIWIGGFSFGIITDGYEKYQKLYNNPPENLLFTGIVDRSEMVKYYNLADVFLLPSYSELFPMSILEAFSCGTPVMVRDLELYRAIIDGYYIAGKDAEDMGQKLEKFKNNPSLLKPYQDLASSAAEYYSEENVAKIWHDFYHDLVNKS